MKGHGNWTYGEHRSDNGRQGRGESALTAKEARSWKATLARIERIVAMAERGGGTVCRPRLLKLPIKGVKV